MAPTPRLTQAATALRIRFDLGLFDPIAGNPYAQPLPPSLIDGPAHRKARARSSQGYSSTYLAMGFANVRAGTW